MLRIVQEELERDLRQLLSFFSPSVWDMMWVREFGWSDYLYLIALFWHLAKILLVFISSKPQKEVLLDK